jgi:hypothetical protein
MVRGWLPGVHPAGAKTGKMNIKQKPLKIEAKMQSIGASRYRQ